MEGGGGQGSAKKVLRIIWMAPKAKLLFFSSRLVMDYLFLHLLVGSKLHKVAIG